MHMAKEDAIGAALGRAAREVADALESNSGKDSNGRLGGLRGIAVGAGLVALAPAAGKALGRFTKSGSLATIGEKLGEGVKSTVADKLEDAGGGATERAKKAGKSLKPSAGADEDAQASNDEEPSDAEDDSSDAEDDSSDAEDESSDADDDSADARDESTGVAGVGSGRRMPVQQAIDVAVPLRTAYNEWTQFEEWPKFMHRVDRATQDDETHVTLGIKVWGISKPFQAEIVEQRPDERIKWRAEQGPNHAGVVTFHKLSDRLTRIEVTLDLVPSSLLEKAGRGMRHVKRAVRADMARFKAHLEMEGEESGAWRGVIEDGKVKPRRKSSSSNRKSSSSNGRRRGSSSRGRAPSSNGRRSGNTRSRSRSRS